MISHQYKCIFLHIPKCAGTSIEAALGFRDGLAGRGLQDHRTLREIERPFLTPCAFGSLDNLASLLRRVRNRLRHEPNPNAKRTVTKSQFADYFTFTFVRNPWARSYSWYRAVMRDQIMRDRLKITASTSFAECLGEFAGKGLLRPQVYWLKDYQGKISVDFIGRFENLQDDFAEVCKRLGTQSIALPHLIKGSASNYREAYDGKTKELVERVYREEIDLFGYSFEQ